MEKDEELLNEDLYGIDRESAHPRAIELAPEDFFWNSYDELAPFGSDEGDMALAEFREWRAENKEESLLTCLRWVIESLSDYDFEDFTPKLLDISRIKSELENDDFDDYQEHYVIDISVMATGFGQLVDEGKIDEEAKPIIQLSIDRQEAITNISAEEGVWDQEVADEYIANLHILKRILLEA